MVPSVKKVKKPRKTDRPGRSRRRRRYKKYRKDNFEIHFEAASKIQKAFRHFLDNRYRSLAPTNYEDSEYIGLEDVRTIPKGLLVSIEGTGYNANSLLKWFCTSQVDPVTRKPVGPEVPIECVCRITDFIERDYILHRRRKGYFKNRRKYTDVIKMCVK